MKTSSEATQPKKDSDGPGVDFDKMWGSYQKNLAYQEKLDSESYEISPIAGFVAEASLYWLDKKGKYMKSKNSDTTLSTTVFINVCSSFLVSEPLMENNPDADPRDPETHQRFRVPVACGPAIPVEGPDKSVCIAYDACFNTSVLEQAAKENDYRNFVSDIAAQNIAIKEATKDTPIEIKGPFKILKIPYKGPKGVNEPLKQRIRKKGTSKIQEVNKSPVPQQRLNVSTPKYCPPPPAKRESSKGLNKRKVPDTARYQVGVITKNGEVQKFEGQSPSELNKMVIAIDLEKCKLIGDISIKLVNQKFLRLADKSGRYRLELSLPLSPIENGSCSWDRKKKVVFCCFEKFK